MRANASFLLRVSWVVAAVMLALITRRHALPGRDAGSPTTVINWAGVGLLAVIFAIAIMGLAYVLWTEWP